MFWISVRQVLLSFKLVFFPVLGFAIWAVYGMSAPSAILPGFPVIQESFSPEVFLGPPQSRNWPSSSKLSCEVLPHEASSPFTTTSVSAPGKFSLHRKHPVHQAASQMIFLWGLSAKDYFSVHNKLDLISNLSSSFILLVYPDCNTGRAAKE